MSVRIMARVWDDPDLTNDTEVLVMLALADFADDEGWCFPSVARVAQKARKSERTVQRAISRLEEAGKIHRSLRTGQSTRYRITPSIIDPRVVPGVAESEPDGGDTSDGGDTMTGRRPCQGGGDTSDTLTITEPSERERQTRARSRFTSEQIESIYQTYPRKVGKRKAVEEIRLALKRIAAGASGPDPPPEDPAAWLESRTEEFASSPAGQRGKLTPHPSTWYHQDRFDDDPAEWYRQQPERTNGSSGPLSARQYAGLSYAEKLERAGFKPEDFE